MRVLKRDGFGRVELCASPEGLRVRRVASGGRLPGSRWIARLLLARERRALRALDGLPGVARVIEVAPDDSALVRSWIAGRALCEASELPRDFFERLEELVSALHERGVCHNDLHKEGNVLVGEDGRPGLVDFQLASVHARRGRAFATRAREDLRHVWKHRSLYYRALGVPDPLLGREPRRSFLAELWRRTGKPLYNRVTGLARLRAPSDAGEPRRPKEGPWPCWTAPVGPRSAATRAGSSPAAPRPAR